MRIIKPKKIININWETDNQNVDLPKEVDCPQNIDDINYIADYLSDKYGWLVNSFDVK